MNQKVKINVFSFRKNSNFVEFSKKLQNSGLSPYQYDEHFQQKCSPMLENKVRSMLTKEALSAINIFTKQQGCEVLLLKNSPIDAVIPSSPIDTELSLKDFVSEFVLLGLSAILKTKAICSRTNRVKRFKPYQPVHQITPKANHEKAISGYGSYKTFPLHTDRAFDPKQTPFFAFYCLRNLEKTPTNIVTINEIVGKLPENVIVEMKKPNFMIGFSPNNFDDSIPTPLLTNNNGETYLRLHLDPSRT